jgi:two-component system, cell cycle sensor histidine kinase and response regulator CckA
VETTESDQKATIRRLSTAVDVWEIGVFEHDHATEETWASPRFREMLGFGPDEYVSMQVVARLCFAGDVPMIEAAMRRVNDPDGDGIFDMTYRVVRLTGEIRWVRGRGITSFGMVDGVRQPVRTIGTIADVTEQHELRLAAERHEQRLTLATNTSQVGVFDWDHDAARPEDAVYWSPTFRDMIGYDANAQPDLEWYRSRIHPDDLARLAEATKKAKTPENPTTLDVEYRWLHPSGETRWCIARSTTTFRKKAHEVRPDRTVGAVLDVTTTLNAAEQLSERSAILEATPDIVSIVDPELGLVFLNKAGRSFAGISPDADVTSVSLASVVGSTFEKQFREHGREAARRKGSWQIETDFSEHSGQLRPVSALVLCHADRHGQVSHFSLVARNLSHEKQLEMQFRRSQKMDAIGRLAGGIAHDFNNILSVILGFSESLEDYLPPDSPGRRDINEITVATGRAAALTRQLLTISRNELVRPRPMDLNDVVQAAGPMFRRLIDARIEIKVDLADAPARIKADPSQIEQVLLNLVVNARDAMPNGGTLSIEVTQVIHRPEAAPRDLHLPAGPYVVLVVSDSGHGIPEEVRERVFEPFFTTKEQGKGTGLGLATVLGIVEKNGGAVWLHSEPSRGTTFKVYLPSTDEVPEVPAEQPTGPILHRGGTIVLVEDEPQLRSMMKAVLERAGYRVFDASGPVEALGLIQGICVKIDLLVTDVVMPQMTGVQLAAEIKKVRPEIPVLFVTGYTDDAVDQDLLLGEHVDFLQKPIRSLVLLRKVAKVIARREKSVG